MIRVDKQRITKHSDRSNVASTCKQFNKNVKLKSPSVLPYMSALCVALAVGSERVCVLHSLSALTERETQQARPPELSQDENTEEEIFGISMLR